MKSQGPFSLTMLSILICLIVSINADPRRRNQGGGRSFEPRPGMGNVRYVNEVGEEFETITEQVESTITDAMMTRHAYSAATVATDVEKAAARSRADERDTVSILRGKNVSQTDEYLIDLENAATAPAYLEKEKIFWIDATYKASDAGMNVSQLDECQLWRKYWDMEAHNLTADQFEFITSVNESNPLREADSSEKEIEEKIYLVEYELVESKSRLRKLQLNTDLFDKYEVVGVLFKEICGNHERQLIFKTPEDARKIGIDANSTICGPFKVELQPNTDILMKLSLELNQVIERSQKRNVSEKGAKKSAAEDLKIFLVSSHNMVTIAPKTDDETPNDKNEKKSDKAEDLKARFRLKRKIMEKAKKKDDAASNGKKRKDKSTTVATTDPLSAEENQDEADWLELLAFSNQMFEQFADNETLLLEKAWLQIDATDETNPVMYLLFAESADALLLAVPRHAFRRHEKVGLFLPGVCADFVPTAIDAFNASDFEGIEIEGPIGVNITALELAGVNLTELAEKLRNDTEVDEILTRTDSSSRALGGSYILPVLNKNQYDPFSAPIVFQGSAVVVRFGIYIESMSNFQTSTMDYDMDIYLLLAWRDARLVNPYDKPILVKEEEILEKIWRPDPFFDAKEAEFHEVTFLNFLMRIYNDGLVMYETRIKMKPACNLVLCKYPHDKQTCELQIKSFAYPIETVRFEWFTRKADAIDKNPDVKLPELYIDRYEPTFCNRSRKSGHFSCLRAVFRLKRDVGFHIAQTYIPTSLALMFSWVGVWLPEEFMEGRIGVAITVLLTLSTESAGAREHLPSVSYLKAIDLWFGYITGFVFFTLLQTLFIIGFDKRANQLRKWANRKRLDLTQETRDSMIMKANRYHKTGRYLDNFCRVFYPLSFLLFLIMYYFVFTEGRQDDCISTR